MAYNLEPRTIKENLLGLIGKNPHAEPRPANTREECFLADIAENGGGLPEVTSEDNGDVLGVVDGEWAKAPAPSSLPHYTSADKGKVLTVGEGSESETATIVPEQTVTKINDGFDPCYVNINEQYESINVGDSVSVVVDGVSYYATVEENDGVIGIVWDGNVIFRSDETPSGKAEFLPTSPGTYNISASVTITSVEPKWEAAQGAVVFRATDARGVVSSDATYNEIEAAYNDGTKPIILRVTYNDIVINVCTLISKEATGISFFALYTTGPGLNVKRYFVNTSNEWTYTNMEITGTWQ